MEFCLAKKIVQNSTVAWMHLSESYKELVCSSWLLLLRGAKNTHYVFFSYGYSNITNFAKKKNETMKKKGNVGVNFNKSKK